MVRMVTDVASVVIVYGLTEVGSVTPSGHDVNTCLDSHDSSRDRHVAFLWHACSIYTVCAQGIAILL